MHCSIYDDLYCCCCSFFLSKKIKKIKLRDRFFLLNFSSFFAVPHYYLDFITLKIKYKWNVIKKTNKLDITTKETKIIILYTHTLMVLTLKCAYTKLNDKNNLKCLNDKMLFVIWLLFDLHEWWKTIDANLNAMRIFLATVIIAVVVVVVAEFSFKQ